MRIGALALAAVLVVASGLAAAEAATARHERPTKKATGKTWTVTMEAMQFHPAVLNVSSGDTIVWVNKDLLPHSATRPGAFNSNAVAAGKSWKYKVRGKGDLAYACVFHPMMKGTLHVK